MDNIKCPECNSAVPGPIKDKAQVIEHAGVKYRLIEAGYRWIIHKWSFVIEGKNSPIKTGEKIKFLGSEMSVTHTIRRNSTHPEGKYRQETLIEAWVS